MAKADLKIALHYQQKLVPDEAWDIGQQLFEQFQKTQKSVLAITHHMELLQDNPTLKRSVTVRNPYVDPLNIMQAEFLIRVRQNPDDTEHLQALLITNKGVAAGMRNTG